MIVNDTEITALEFAFDGCHKIYLINTAGDKNKFLEYGYDLFPIEQLQDAYEGSCSLRFISDGDLKKEPVKQFEEAVFE